MEYLVDLGIDDLKILQDDEGYEFSQDSVFLANLSSPKRGGRLLDLGAGSGILSIIALLKKGVGSAVLLDVCQSACDLAQKNVALAGIDDRTEVLLCDVKDARDSLKAASFDSVLCNPPYFEANPRLSSSGAKDVARRESTATLADFVAAGAYALKNKGDFNIVVKTTRLATLLAALVNAGLEPKKLTLIFPKPNKDPDVAVVRAVKGGGRGLDVTAFVALNEDGTRTAQYEALYTEYGAQGD